MKMFLLVVACHVALFGHVYLSAAVINWLGLPFGWVLVPLALPWVVLYAHEAIRYDGSSVNPFTPGRW